MRGLAAARLLLMKPEQCESCGRAESNLLKVQRIYLLEPEDTPVTSSDRTDPQRAEPEMVPAAADIEFWCASCCATFPHSVIDETD